MRRPQALLPWLSALVCFWRILFPFLLNSRHTFSPLSCLGPNAVHCDYIILPSTKTLILSLAFASSEATHQCRCLARVPWKNCNWIASKYPGILWECRVCSKQIWGCSRPSPRFMAPYSTSVARNSFSHWMNDFNKSYCCCLQYFVHLRPEFSSHFFRGSFACFARFSSEGASRRDHGPGFGASCSYSRAAAGQATERHTAALLDCRCCGHRSARENSVLGPSSEAISVEQLDLNCTFSSWTGYLMPGTGHT